MDGRIDVPKKFLKRQRKRLGGKSLNEVYLNLKIKNHIGVSLQVAFQEMNSAASQQCYPQPQHPVSWSQLCLIHHPSLPDIVQDSWLEWKPYKA